MPRKILLIRLRLIGDVVLTTPAIRAVRRALPDAHLTYLVEPLAAAAVVGNPQLDEVIVAPLTRGLARVRGDAALALRLRRARFDTVVDFHGGPRSSLLAWASGAPRRVGYDVPGRGWMYTDRIHRPRGHRQRHSVDNQWDLVEAAFPGIPRPDPATDPVEMLGSDAARTRIAARFVTMGSPANPRYVVIHVGAGNEFRRWPGDRFAAVVAALYAAEPKRRIILTTGPGQAEAVEAVRRLAVAAGVPADAVLALCDLDLSELRVLVEGGSLFLGGDSGPAHVASTTAVPMVVIFGPTTPTVWGPWRDPSYVTEIVSAGDLPCRPCDQRQCEPGDFRCLRWITPEMVGAGIARALAREAARRQNE